MTKPKTASRKAKEYASNLTRDRSVFDGNDERIAIVAFTAGYTEGQRDTYASAEGMVEAYSEFSELQDKLLLCYRVGKQPGKWLDKMGPLRDKIEAFQRAKGES